MMLLMERLAMPCDRCPGSINEEAWTSAGSREINSQALMSTKTAEPPKVTEFSSPSRDFLHSWLQLFMLSSNDGHAKLDHLA